MNCTKKEVALEFLKFLFLMFMICFPAIRIFLLPSTLFVWVLSGIWIGILIAAFIAQHSHPSQSSSSDRGVTWVAYTGIG